MSGGIPENPGRSQNLGFRISILENNSNGHCAIIINYYDLLWTMINDY
jgi:hypothetical protein